jgi:hypothetical protein
MSGYHDSKSRLMPSREIPDACATAHEALRDVEESCRYWGMPMSPKERPELVTSGALRVHTSSDLHRIDFGDARVRNSRKRFLGPAARSGRRVLHLQRSTSCDTLSSGEDLQCHLNRHFFGFVAYLRELNE